jgi:hypothetical protein
MAFYVTGIATAGRVALLGAALWLTGNSIMLFDEKKSRNARGFFFGKLNAYFFVFVAALVFDRLF